MGSPKVIHGVKDDPVLQVSGQEPPQLPPSTPLLDPMENVGGPQRSYPEGFMSLSLFLAEIHKLVVLVKKTLRTEYIRQTDTGEI